MRMLMQDENLSWVRTNSITVYAKQSQCMQKFDGTLSKSSQNLTRFGVLLGFWPVKIRRQSTGRLNWVEA
jgi:hypothetical protein